MGPQEAAYRLLENVLARYGTIEEFVIALSVDPLADTVELPAVPAWNFPR
jgi:hypothetical protein